MIHLQAMELADFQPIIYTDNMAYNTS